MRGQSVRGTPESAALMGNPFFAPPPLIGSGVPLGVDLRTRRLVMMDPWLLKQQRIIHSMVFWVLGQKDYGKSTLLKSLAARLLTLQVGHENGVPIEPRARIHSRKPEDGEDEFQPLANFLGSQSLHLMQGTSVNILDPAMNMTELDIIETVAKICEQISGTERFRSGLRRLALQVAVTRMTKAPHMASLNILASCSRSLTLDDVNEFYNRGNARDRETWAPELAERPELIAELGLDYVRPREDAESQRRFFEEFQQAAVQNAGDLGWITAGGFGEIFGGKGSLRDALSQPMVNVDWTGVNDEARALLESMLWKWQTTALNRNDLSLIPHLVLGDEEAEALASEMHAAFQAAYTAKARAYHTVDIRATQYLSQILEAGAEGSVIRGYARAIVQGVGCWFIGRQVPRDEILHDLTQLGLSDFDAYQTTQLGIGQFAILVPGKRVIFLQYILTPTELELVRTDAATRRATDRLPVLGQSQLHQIAQSQGIVTVGRM
jgi:hypothetical protein